MNSNSVSKARLVKVPAPLIPRQRHTPPAFQKACDFRMFWSPKHPAAPSEFHSYAEYLHAGLLEMDPQVTAFVPQPFMVTIRGKRYTPDCYVARNGQRVVIEIKPNGLLSPEILDPMTEYCTFHNLLFQVISNEAIQARQVEAENGVTLAHCLHAARDIDTASVEMDVLAQVHDEDQGVIFGDFIDPGHREAAFEREIAVLRLIHRGLLLTNLDRHTLDYTTEVKPCISPGVNA